MSAALGYIFLVVIVGAFLVAIVRPWLAFVLIVCFPVIEQALQGYFPVMITHLTLFNYLIAGIVAVSLLVRFASNPGMLAGALNPVSKTIVLLLALSWISLFWTPELENGLMLTVNRFQYTLLYIIMAPLLITSLDDFRRLRLPLIALGCLALVGILFGPKTMFYGTRLMIQYSTTEVANANALGELGALILVFAVLTTQAGVGRLVVPFQAIAGIFGMGMGLLSGARGQVLAGGLIAFLFFPVSRKVKNNYGYLGLGLGAAFVVLLIYISVQFFITSDNLERWSLNSLTDGFELRFLIVSEAMKPWITSPLSWFFGRGAGAFITAGLVDTYPHNYIIEALTEMGLVGLFLYLMILFFTIKSAVGLFSLYRDDSEMRSAVALLCAVAVFFFLISLKQGTVHDPGTVFLWYLVIARVYWYERLQADLDDDEYDQGMDEELDPEEHGEYDSEGVEDFDPDHDHDADDEADRSYA
jgi:hypothetical protein